MQVGYHGPSVSEVAEELGRDWHTVMDAMIAYGEPLDDYPRFGDTDALGLDETLFCKTGRYRRQNWSTSIVDVRNEVLLDVRREHRVHARTNFSWPLQRTMT